MKLNVTKILIVIFIFSLGTGCSSALIRTKSTPAKSLPPGQAKKLSGDQSAKQHAPGQKKKKK